MNEKTGRKFRFVEGRERLFVYAIAFFTYVILIVSVALIYSNLIDKTKLEMKFESEKSFNSVYMTLNDNPSSALKTMNEEGVSAIGVYNTTGRLYSNQALGSAPRTLSLSKFVGSQKNEIDSTMGIYVFSPEDKQIEYLRFSRFNAMLETGNLYFSDGKLSSTVNEYPEIVYIKFDGAKYFNSVARIRLLTFIVIIILTGVEAFVLNMYENNRRFRSEFEKTKSLANLGEAARTLTHEIKNPLSAMTIQSAIMHKTLPSEFSEDLDVFDHEINRLTNLTNRVSEFLKNPQGNPSEIELVSFLRQIIDLFHKDIVFISRVETARVLFDPDLARSVFENLIKNALESTQDRNPEVCVSLEIIRRSRVRVRVLDRGDGIKADDREKIFNPFYTTKIHGSGIGLSISRQFVQARGGSLRLYSRDGGGTVSEVVLDLYS